MSTYALIVAAGNGLRLGADLPKQYLKIVGCTILEITVRKFLEHPSIDGVMVVIAEEHRHLYEEATASLRLLPCAYGGATRQISVHNGLKALSLYSPSKVLIHDAARPMLGASLIGAVVSALDAYDAVDVKVSVPDTIKQNTQILDRSGIYLTQTPQGFEFS
jgi:2-C-methyl-D-erythritol 4-phosphate cytidylyltransferase/2-C-methyl-D-erythritol 2,4-cyclodiphosphate synthase